MNLSDYGYRLREVKVHGMEMGEVKNMVLQAMVRNEAENSLVRLVNATAGEVSEYDGMKQFILADLNNRYEVNVTSMTSVHLNDRNRDAIVVVFLDDVDL